MSDLINSSIELLEDYRYNPSRDAVSKILKRWENAKEGLLEAFRRHPNWNEDQKAIILDAEYIRGFDMQAPQNFSSWINIKANQLSNDYEIFSHDGKPLTEIERFITSISNKINVVEKLSFMGYDVSELRIQLAADLQEAENILGQYVWDSYHYIPKDIYAKIKKLRDIAEVINGIREGETIINERLHDCFEKKGFNVPTGAKTSKAVRKLLSQLGFFEDQERNKHGSLLCEKKYAEFSDGINPLKIKAKTYISINPLDYWTMSFGHNWASCHTIDIHNIRYRQNGEHTYNGCYSAGTESYMLDPSTVIVYTGEMMDKWKRCNFHISADGLKIVQGRVYPDARDDGDFTYAPQFRQIVQDIVSKCYAVPNLWTVKKGTEECKSVIEENIDKCNYSDYFSYDDCNVSLNKAVESDEMVIIGHAAICPKCGALHTHNENICCEDCCQSSYTYCSYCDDGISENDNYIYTMDERYYCCAECAEAAGYCYCSDVDEWTDNYYIDPYENVCYYDFEVEMLDGSRYRTESNAIRDGWMRAEDRDGVQVWARENDVYISEDGTAYTYDYDGESEAI